MENRCTFLLAKEQTWKRIFNTNSELSQNRTEKQIMLSKTTINWLFSDKWCYLFIACFDWKIRVFQQTVVRVYYMIVIRNGKIVWKHGPCCWYFHLNLKYLEWSYRAFIKTAKNGNFCQELLSKNDFEAILTTFTCYDHGAKASEEVQKIVTDQIEHRKCSLCVILCSIAKIYLWINDSEKWLVIGIPLT